MVSLTRLVLVALLAAAPDAAGEIQKTPSAKEKAGEPDRVEVLWGAKWYPATIVKRDGEKAFVKYDGWPDTSNEWVSPDRVRPIKGSAKRGVKPTDPPAARPVDADESGLPVVETDLSGVKEIDLSADSSRWAVKPEGAGLPKGTLGLKPIALGAAPGTKVKPKAGTGAPAGFFEKPRGLLFAGPQAATAVVAFINAPPGEAAKTRVELCDLASGKPPRSVEIGRELLPLDVSADGRFLLTRAEPFSGEKDRVDVWAIEASGAKPIVSFKPYGEQAWPANEVRWARFVDPNLVLTLSGRGRLVLWEVEGVKAVYAADVPFNVLPALSAGRHQLAVPTHSPGGGVAILDTRTGDPLGALVGPIGFPACLAFSEDGASLAAVSPQRVRTWDLNTGEPTHDVYLPSPLIARHADWVSPGFLLVDGSSLIDLPRRIILWQYTLPGADMGEVSGVFSGKFWHIDGGDAAKPRRSLLSLALPHPEARKLAATLDPDTLLALQPGVKVSLEINIQGGENDRSKTLIALVKKLEAHGFEVSDGQPLKLTASTGTGQTREVSYRASGLGGETTTRSVTEQVSTLTLTENGAKLWESTAVSGASPVLLLREGQSVDQALAETAKPNLRFFEEAALPTHLARPGKNGGAYGASPLP